MKKTHIFFNIVVFALAMPIAQSQTPRFGWGKPVEAVLCEGANSGLLDFSAVPKDAGILFTSNRGAAKGNLFDANEKMFCTDLWYAERKGFGQYNAPAKLAGKVNTDLHEGVASLMPGAASMVYSGTNAADCSEATGRARLQLFEATNMDNAWKKPTALPLNMAGYASCHPTLSADGQWMVFASDRPGSLGGMDLWASQRQPGGTWSVPQNLGAGVNTNGHELFPFLGPDGNLYFSSNGHGGKGRLDIFAAARAKDGDMGTWGKPVALSEPFNSDQDDFGFFLNKDLLGGWFSSNRGDGANDELWEWRAPAKPTMIPNLAGVVREKGGPALSGQIVILRNKQTGEIKRLTSDAAGNFSFADLACDTDYELVVNPDGPRTEKRDISTWKVCDNGEPKTEKVLVELPAPKPAFVPGLVGTVQEKPSGKPIVGAKVILRNKKTGQIVETLTSDLKGNFRIPKLDCDTDYEIVANPDGPNPERRELTTRGLCEGGMKPAEQHVLVELPVNELAVSDMKVGTVIRLNKLYYDYDKSDIRSDAAVELDKVVALMKQYPSMVIELSSHTDSRGSDSYNLGLSERRAVAARGYILSRGIEANRITAAGRGETQLVNTCKNGTKCTDPEHEQNRRTEIKVVSIQEKGVKVEN